METADCKSRVECRRAVTLLELLVVIGILMLLIGVAIPTMQPALESRRIREAARAVNVYCGAARNRALETGRPCGVVIQRVEGLADCSDQLKQAEEPPSYAGESLFSVAGNFQVNANNNIATLSADFSGLAPDKVHVGDLVQLNGQGPFYTITGVGGTNLTMQTDVSGGLLLPWNGGSLPVPYEIFRRPTLTMANPLQLPSTTVIDLRDSGTDDAPQWLKSSGPGDEEIIIMFSPNGSVHRVYLGGQPIAVTQPIYLLVGRREQMLIQQPGNPGTDPDELLLNYQILSNLWVTLNPQTGLVTCTQMATTTAQDDVAGARRYAREAQSMGGN